MLWFLVTVCLPVFLPVLAMLLFRIVPAFAPKAEWIAPVKDGQLCWFAMGSAFSGMYEVLYPSNAAAIDGDTRGVAVILFAILALISAFLAAVGAVDPVSTTIPAGAKWYKHYSVMLVSMLLTVFAIVGYTVIHFKAGA